eukprot:Opistho-2@15445
MARIVKACVLVVLLASFAAADVYMHNPRGSNNRLNEQSANRNNANRLFDSQNNNRGGYNAGDKTQDAAGGNAATPSNILTMIDDTATGNMQYNMVFYENSILPIEWTNQHGCGGRESDDPQQLNCAIILQYTCDSTATVDDYLRVSLRDGTDTGTPNEPNSLDEAQTKTRAGPTDNTGRHESEVYYFECKNRRRNQGLFTADQKLNGNSARFTRQNPGGTRRGLECPEERDYYPYWHPTMWRDIALLTDKVELPYCQNGAVIGSNNNVARNRCDLPSAGSTDARVKAITANNQAECTTAGGQWTSYSHGLAAPECRLGDWSRPNHLGNGRNGQPNTYNWTIPRVTTDSKFQLYNGNMARCVVRLRYNISTDDYHPSTNSSYNKNEATGQKSIIEENPVVDVGADFQGLRLAINTAQYGRTFQDRSHVFIVRQRPAGLAGSLFNINVRGKRGNIVQTYPSVEYDFQPNQIHVKVGDFIHWQWTGSNTHNNGDPAGDGQAGDAGEGRGGTDRSNVVASLSSNDNYPIPFTTDPTSPYYSLSLFNMFTCYLPRIDNTGMDQITPQECAVFMATSSRTKDIAQAKNTDALLNNAPASLVRGIIMKATAQASGRKFYYLCSRNNNFSNRSQKGVIIVA